MLFRSGLQTLALLPLVTKVFAAQTSDGTQLGAISILAEDTLVSRSSLPDRWETIDHEQQVMQHTPVQQYY